MATQRNYHVLTKGGGQQKWSDFLHRNAPLRACLTTLKITQPDVWKFCWRLRRTLGVAGIAMLIIQSFWQNLMIRLRLDGGGKTKNFARKSVVVFLFALFCYSITSTELPTKEGAIERSTNNVIHNARYNCNLLINRNNITTNYVRYENGKTKLVEFNHHSIEHIVRVGDRKYSLINWVHPDVKVLFFRFPQVQNVAGSANCRDTN